MSGSALLLTGGPGSGEDANRRDDPGRETPRQKRLHEEVPGGSQPGRGRLDRRQGGQRHQAQGGCPPSSTPARFPGFRQTEAAPTAANGRLVLWNVR